MWMLTERLLEYSLMGAEWVLWLLVALSLVSFAVVIDRVLLYLRTREQMSTLEPALLEAMTRCDLHAAKQAVQRDSLVGNVLRAGLEAVEKGRPDIASAEQAMLGAMARERDRFEARLPLLGTVGNNAPFIGLFGTVLGIIQAFHQLGQLDATSAASNQIVMGAISEALIATGVGIAVAIPAVVAFNWGKSTVASRMKNAEALMRVMLAGMGKLACRDESVGKQG